MLGCHQWVGFDKILWINETVAVYQCEYEEDIENYEKYEEIFSDE
jgi:hypothetical protein